MHALAINRTEDGIKIEAWWEELRNEELNSQRFLFLHLIDSSGKILFNKQILLYPYEPPFDSRRWRRGTVTFNLQLPHEKVTSLAFGIYHPNNSFLLADKGRTDWEGKPVLIPLTSVTGSISQTPASVQR